MTRGQSGNNKQKKKASLSQTPEKDIDRGNALAEYAKELSASSKPNRNQEKHRDEALNKK